MLEDQLTKIYSFIDKKKNERKTRSSQQAHQISSDNFSQKNGSSETMDKPNSPLERAKMFSPEQQKLLNTILINANNKLKDDNFMDDDQKKATSKLLKEINIKIGQCNEASEALPKELTITATGKSPAIYTLKN